jgi:hypothetical protein
MSSLFPVCSRPSFNTNFVLNATIHILILLSIVSGFFFFYVSGLSQEKYQSEIKKAIEENLIPQLEKIDTSGTLKSTLQKLDLEKLSEYYALPSSSKNNWWLSRVTALALLMLLISVIGMSLILQQSCNQCPPLWDIIKENIYLFTLVGMVEVGFFMMIARKFVPTKPSLMISSVVKSIQKNL